MARRFLCSWSDWRSAQPNAATGGFPKEACAASLCRMRAQAACSQCHAAPSAQVNSPARFTSPVVYKTAAPEHSDHLPRRWRVVPAPAPGDQQPRGLTTPSRAWPSKSDRVRSDPLTVLEMPLRKRHCIIPQASFEDVAVYVSMPSRILEVHNALTKQQCCGTLIPEHKVLEPSSECNTIRAVHSQVLHTAPDNRRSAISYNTSNVTAENDGTLY